MRTHSVVWTGVFLVVAVVGCDSGGKSTKKDRGTVSNDSAQPSEVGVSEAGVSEGGVDSGPGLEARVPEGGWREAQTSCPCPLGCQAGTTTCRKLVPSGGFTATAHEQLPAIGSEAMVDTTACSLTVAGKQYPGNLQTGAAAGKACVFAFDSVTVSSAGKLRAKGEYPLVLLVDKEVRVEGLIDVGAKGVTPGPGGALGGVIPAGGPGRAGAGLGAGTVCQCASGADDCGGGGAGFGTAGAAGGEEDSGCSTSSSQGGPAYGDPSLVLLAAGSGGASGGQASAGASAGDGGAGGGAIQISCGGVITVSGAISAGGGGGRVGPTVTSETGAGSGGGGGSGGGILLEAAKVIGAGTVAANGGGGGGSSSSTCGAGTDGEDGPASTVVAKGGDSGVGCGEGGAGGGSTAPVKGNNSVDPAGGGGGAAGRIRLNWYQHGSMVSIKLSGQVSFGEVGAQ